MTARLALVLLLASCVGPLAAQEGATEEKDLFDPDRVIRVSLELPEKDWEELRHQSRQFFASVGETPAPRPFTWFEAKAVIDGRPYPDIRLRKKGFIGSLDDVRPSLKIRFDGKAPVGVDRLTLNNNVQDDSVVTQYVGYRLIARAGIPASRCNLAHVTVNGVDLGIYSNVESVRSPFLERAFGSAKGDLYEGTLADFHALGRFEAKRSSRPVPASALKVVADLLAGEGKLPLKELEARIDLDAFLRFWVMESLTGAWDGYVNNQNNFFIYENPATKRLCWIPWGTDALFTREPPIPGIGRGPAAARAHALLTNRLYHDERVRPRYRAMLDSALKTWWEEDAIVADYDKAVALASKLLHASQSDEIESAVEKRKRFVRARRAQIAKELEDWPLDLPDEPRKPFRAEQVGVVSGTFKAEWFDRTPSDASGRGEATLDLRLGEKPAKFTELGVVAGPSRPMPGERVEPGRPRPPSIVFNGTREGGRAFMLAIGTPRNRWRAGATEIPVEGMLMDGNWFRGFRGVTGTLVLEKAGLKPGDEVAGRLDLKVLELKM